MPNQFTEVTTKGLGSRLGDSVKGIVLGVLLFIGSFGLLYWNEGRADLSVVAKTSVAVDATNVNSDKSSEGMLVAASGSLTSEQLLGDQIYLRAGKYIRVQRMVEMYSWVEKSESKSTKNTGGSETTETTYKYTTEWVNNPADSDNFRIPEDHANPDKMVSDLDTRVTEATIGQLSVDPANLTLPTSEKLALTENMVGLDKGDVLIGNEYLFISHSGESTYTNPRVGDVRINFEVVPADQAGTVFGKLEGSTITPFLDNDGNQLFRFFNSNREQAIAQLHTEYTTSLWFFRIFGFILMWLGLFLFFGPVGTLLDVLPIAGSISKSIIGAATFLVALVLSIITIIVSAIVHSFIAVIIVGAIILGISFFLVPKFMKRKMA